MKKLSLGVLISILILQFLAIKAKEDAYLKELDTKIQKLQLRLSKKQAPIRCKMNVLPNLVKSCTKKVYMKMHKELATLQAQKKAYLKKKDKK